jgi:uncharacterized circularly permuted ATP-grasp superfamily protein
MTISNLTQDAALFSEWQYPDGRPREHYARLAEVVEALGTEGLAQRWAQAQIQVELDAFTFYLDPRQFRPAPTDWIPRVIPMDHWEVIEAGVSQRIRATNRFLVDLYNGGQDIVPDDVMFTSQHFYPEVQGFRPPKDLFVHIYGIDLVHLGDAQYCVLEDNLRIPSGISYQIKSVELVSRVIPEFAGGYDIEPYDIRGAYLEMFRSLCDVDSPVCVLLTDGKFGSAFFEHRYLSELLGIPLVEGTDLYVGHDGRVFARTLDQDMPVDIIYRRVEDLDIFVPGLRDAYLNHKVVLVNGIGTGAVDDKLVFMWVPEMIEKYLGETPILRQAPSYNLQDPESRRFVTENLDDMVVKARQGYGGTSVFVMPDLGPTHRARVAQSILEEPDVFIAQETLDFSNHMVFNDANGMLEPRHIDLRVFAIQDGNDKVTVFPGGLTRVARPGGRITNNSSGGICKPTWVVR